MTVRVLVVGTGFGARVVAPIFDATAGCEVVEVVSARSDVARAISERRPDLVSVHSPPFLHATHARTAVESGAAVLCDKPCTPSAAETAELLAAIDGVGGLHLVNFEFRCDPAREELRRLVADGAIGDVRHVTWIHHSAGSRIPMRPHGWLFDRALGGGWIGAWASHAIDALRWLLGSELTVVDSRPRIDIAERVDRGGEVRRCTAEDGLVAFLRTERGTTITLDSTFAAAASLPPRLLLLGDEATIECVADERVTLRRRLDERVEIPIATQAGTDRHQVPMRRWASVVRDAVENRSAPAGVPTLVDGLACDRVLDALRDGR